MRRDARLALRLVLSEPRDVNDADEQGFTLLYSTTGSDLLLDEHLALARELIARGADVNEQGSWTAYRRQSRKDVLRLRSLVLRGRTKDAADPVAARVLRLPNELCWHVLQFWRATSAATGEVI